MTLILAGLAGAALAVLVTVVILRSKPADETWICAACLYSSRSYEHALQHVQAVHPRVH